MHIQIEKINGLADEKAACGIFTKRITFEGGVVGTIVSTILVHGGEGKDSQTYLRDIFEISTQKLEDGNGKPLEVLKEAGEACRFYIEQRNLNVSFVNALVYKNAFYVGRYKDGVHVWVFAQHKSLELTFDYGSGLLASSQIFLIGTEKFFSTFDTAVLAGDSTVDLEGIIDGLATEISADEAQSEIGVAIIYVKDEKGQDVIGGEEEGKEGLRAEEVEKAVGDENHTVLREAPQSMLGVEAGYQTAEALGRVSKIFKGIWGEIKKLRKGDIGAVIRFRRNIVMVAFLVLLVLAFSAFMTIRSQRDKGKLAQFNDHMKNASTKFMEGDAILELNRDRARNALAVADNEVKAALSLKPGNSDAKSLADKISQKLKDTESVSVVNFGTFADVGEPLVELTLLKDGLVAFSTDKMYKIGSNGESGDKADTGSSISRGFFYNDSGFVVGGNKVYKQSFSVNKQGFGAGSAQEVAEGSNTGDIAVFLGNIYLLGENQIAKYVPIAGGYAKSVDYLNNPEQFAAGSRFAIDGSVWVTNGKSINKYTRGAKEDFAISGLSDTNGEFGEIYTNSDIDNLYVVDKSNSALLVIKKDGVYQKAYQSGEFAKATSIVVDEVGGKLYISDGSKILEASL
jgi:hypothetical protein